MEHEHPVSGRTHYTYVPINLVMLDGYIHILNFKKAFTPVVTKYCRFLCISQHS